MAQSKLIHWPCYFKRDNFCYVCAEYLQIGKRVNFRTPTNLTNFENCYGFRPVLTHSYKPTSICQGCRTDLSRAVANKNHKLNFSSPAYWKQPLPGHSNCLLCRASFDKKSSYFPSLNFPATLNVVKPISDKLSSALLHVGFEQESPEDDPPDTFSDVGRRIGIR